MKRSWLVIPVLAGALSAPLAQAATSGTANVTLAASPHSMVQILDPVVTLLPSATDYDNDYVEAAGASGLRVRVKTNSSTGVVLMVKCADASPMIALADLLVRTQTAAGAGGSTMASYSAITAADQNLWSTGAAQHPWLTVTTDVRVQNLINYNDAVGGGTTDYTNTLTYTVVSQ